MRRGTLTEPLTRGKLGRLGLNQEEPEPFRHDAASPAAASAGPKTVLSPEMVLLRARAQHWQAPPDLDLAGDPELLLAAMRRVD